MTFSFLECTFVPIKSQELPTRNEKTLVPGREDPCVYPNVQWGKQRGNTDSGGMGAFSDAENSTDYGFVRCHSGKIRWGNLLLGLTLATTLCPCGKVGQFGLPLLYFPLDLLPAGGRVSRRGTGVTVIQKLGPCIFSASKDCRRSCWPWSHGRWFPRSFLDG